jgi:hypothetical protein
MHKKNKKKWTAPLLTVVVRGKPEEMVLAMCKTGSKSGGNGYVGFNINCDWAEPSNWCFGGCQQMKAS